MFSNRYWSKESKFSMASKDGGKPGHEVRNLRNLDTHFKPTSNTYYALGGLTCLLLASKLKNKITSPT